MKHLVVLAVLIVASFHRPVAAEPGLPTVKPEEVGLSPERFARIDSHMQAYVDDGKLGGVTFAIARRGKLAYFKTFGWANVESERPVERDTLFRIQSMTKPITAVAAMILVEEGRLKLSDLVSKFIPAFADVKVYAGEGADGPLLEPPDTPVSIHHLLTHTSGLTYAAYDPGPVGKIYEQNDMLSPRRSLEELSELAARLPLSRQPGSGYQYGISYDVLARIIEVVSGQSFGDFLEQRVFDPLDMHDTHFVVPAEKRERFAEIYKISKDGRLIPAENEVHRTRYQESARLELGGGGLAATAGDYLRFSQMVLNGGALHGKRILSRKTIELMTVNHLSDAQRAFINRFLPGVGVGLGFLVVTDVAATGVSGSRGVLSWDGGANTYFIIDPAEELIAILFTQMGPFGLYPLREELKVFTYQAIAD